MAWFAALIPAFMSTGAAAGGAAGVTGASVTAAGLGSGAIGTGMTAAGMASAGAASGLTVGGAASSGFSLMSALQLGSSAVSMLQGITGAAQGTSAASAEARYAGRIARMEADSRRIDDRYAAARARALNYSGVQMGAGAPLFDDLENARRISQRYRDRIFQGRVAGMQSKVAGKTSLLSGLVQTAQGGLSLATGLARMRLPLFSE